jgi:uncharacterized protein
MSQLLRTRCVCGWETTGTEDVVVEATLDHGLRVHNMAGSREQVLERAERLDEAGASSDGTPSPAELTVVDVPAGRRFEARLGDRPVGYTRYHQTKDAILLLHTEIDPDLEGRGFGSKLAAAVLADSLSRGLEVKVKCPFISAYVRRHQAEYPEVALDPSSAA